MGMNEEQIKKFKEKIYDPYSEAWSIMKFLKDSDLSKDSTWEEYVNKCNAFGEKYGTDGYYKSLCGVLLDCGFEVGKIMRGEKQVTDLL